MIRDDSLKRLQNDQPDYLRPISRSGSIERQQRQLMPEIDEFTVKGFNDDIGNNILPLNDLEDKIESMENHILNRETGHRDLKKGFFSMIDNVLGAGQSGNTQIANNMSIIQNSIQNVPCISNQQYSQVYDGVNLQYQNPEAPNTVKMNAPQIQMNFGNRIDEKDYVLDFDISPGIQKKQKLFDQSIILNQNAINSTMNSSNLMNSFNLGGPRNLDSSLYDLNQDRQAFITPQVGGIYKMKSMQENHNVSDNTSYQQEFEKEIQSQQSGKKRSRKAYTKKSKKIDESGLSTTQSEAKRIDRNSNPSGSVRFAPEIEEMEDEEDMSFDEDMSNFDITKLTNKKKQYLQDAIIDKNGAYTYLNDPIEYKKARKRLQNRESAVRSRHRKKTYQETLEKQIDDLAALNKRVSKSNKYLQENNAALTSENSILKQQVAYFQETFANSSLVGATSAVTMPQTLINKEDYIHKADLEKFKLELIQKINRRFLDEDEKEKTKNKYIIERNDEKSCSISEQDNIEDSILFKRGDPLESIAGDLKYQRQNGRSRVNSGRLSLSDESRSVTTQPEELDLDKVFVLERDSASSRGKGYLFLAVMFGVMCCSSYPGTADQKIISEPSAQANSGRSTQKHFIPRNMKSHDLGDEQMESKFSNMNLISSDVSDEFINDKELQQIQQRKAQLQQTAHLMKNIKNMSFSQVLQSTQGPFSGIMKSMISGKYTYLAYLICSTACASMWLTPNQHKIRLIKPKSRVSAQKDIEMEF